MLDQNLNDSEVVVVSSCSTKDYIETVACSGEHIVADNSFSHSCHQASRAFSEEVRAEADHDSNEIKLCPDLKAISSVPADSITCALSSDVLTENNIIYLINNNIDKDYIEKVNHSDKKE